MEDLQDVGVLAPLVADLIVYDLHHSKQISAQSQAKTLSNPESNTKLRRAVLWCAACQAPTLGQTGLDLEIMQGVQLARLRGWEKL